MAVRHSGGRGDGWDVEVPFHWPWTQFLPAAAEQLANGLVITQPHGTGRGLGRLRGGLDGPSQGAPPSQLCPPGHPLEQMMATAPLPGGFRVPRTTLRP